MGKNTKRTKTKAPSEELSSRPAPALRKDAEEEETKDNLRFEDPYADEIEEDDVVDDNEDDDDDDDKFEEDEAMADNGDVIQSWNPLTGEALAPGQELEMDPSAYKMHHGLTPEWPSLSFDFLRDDLGESRTRFPHTLTAVVGTQAGQPEENQLTVMKLSDLARILVETADDILGEEYNKEGDDDEDSDEEDLEIDPVLESFSIPHQGGVNRLRAMPQQSHIVATWSDMGQVNLFNLEPIVSKFSQKGFKQQSQASSEIKPYFVHSQHPSEGYALDWSPVKQGYLATGDCAGNIHIWTPRPEGGFEVAPSYESKIYAAGTATPEAPSVEDIQWSPTEATVFCTAECGGYVRIFDTRAQNRAMLSHKIQSNGTDVNVVSWNKLVTNLLACGGDDGALSVWDLRHFSGGKPDPLARFTTHKTPITSVEWHPTDESMLAACDDVGTYIYDLSVEEDDAQTGGDQVDVPPQLLFVHCGSEQFKEVHWHPQISSCLMTTALSGFSTFIPSNL